MSIFTAAIVVRVALLGVGTWQDANMSVKYTDIDYEVYTDAARFITQGQSPYMRSTYRYSPLLAMALTPNVLLHKAFGKVLFCIADLLAARLIQILLTKKKVNKRMQSICLAIWLFSPFTVSISTRGNGEALVTCMLLAMLLLLQNGYLVAAGALFGLAVHWRIYPIIYALPIMRHLALLSTNPSKKSTQSNRKGGGSKQGTHQRRFTLPLPGILSWEGLRFALPSAAVFLALGAVLYYMYGMEFLHETYLYHASRVDPRHNFSPYFYPAYLHTGKQQVDIIVGADGSLGVVGSVLAFLGDSGRAFGLAAVATLATLGWTFASNLPMVFLLQTVAFVAFNKVATAQYFVWYMSWLPLVLPDLVKAKNKGRIAGTAVAWTGTLVVWLGCAYLLEFEGQPVHAAVWVAGLVWVGANAALLKELIVAAKNMSLKSR